MNMNWKDTQTYATLGALVAGVVTAFGVVTADEASQFVAGAVQVAGGVLAIVAAVAAVKARKNPPAARR